MMQMSSIYRLLLAGLLASLLIACAHNPEPFVNESSLAEEEQQYQQSLASMRQQGRDIETSRRQQAAADAEAQEEETSADQQLAQGEQKEMRRTGLRRGMDMPMGGMSPASMPSVSMPGVLR